VRLDESFELADQPAVYAEREVSVDSILECGQPCFLQARDLVLSEPLVGEIGQRLTAPQPKRLVQQLAAARGVTGEERMSRVRDDRLKAFGVDLIRSGRQQVPAAAGQQDLVAQCLAQMRDIPLQRFCRRHRRSLVP
jgi:hypothetical protein